MYAFLHRALKVAGKPGSSGKRSRKQPPKQPFRGHARHRHGGSVGIPDTPFPIEFDDRVADAVEHGESLQRWRMEAIRRAGP
jgi:hypothetical protein